MIYLLSLRKYLVVFLKTALFTAGLLLFYLFPLILSYKTGGNPHYLVDALKNYGSFLFYSLPIICIIATSLFFGFEVSFDRLFALRFIPMLAGVNAILLLVFFVVKLDFDPLPKHKTLYVQPEIMEGYVNPINGYPIYVKKLNQKGDTILDGYLLYNNLYSIAGGKITKKQIYLTTGKEIGSYGIQGRRIGFVVPRSSELYQISSTAFSTFFLGLYENYVRILQTIFASTFTTGGLASSIIAIVLMSVGFFTVVAGIAFFLGKQDIRFLSFSAIIITSLAEVFLFRYFLSLVEVIKLGIKVGFWRVTIPALLIALFAGLIGFGLIQLKEILIKKAKEGV